MTLPILPASPPGPTLRRRPTWYPAAARAIALLVLLPAAAAAACTRSAADLGPDQIATQVAATLTAVASPPRSAGLPTWTPPPSATIPPTPTQTQTPTATVGPSSTPTVPALPTDDPRYGLNLAAPDYTDDFSQNLWFGFIDPTSATNVWSQGRFLATDHIADSFIWWSTSARSSGDVYVEVTAEVGACSGKDGSGLALRVGGEGFDQGYSLEFACDGTYRIRKWASGQAPAVLRDWTAGSDIRPGANAVNRMGFLASGSTLYAFANGKPLGGVQDDDYSSGIFGLFAAAAQTQDVEVTFDDFATWAIAP